MIKKLCKISVFTLLLLISCSKEDEMKEELITIYNQQEPLTARQINDNINSYNQAGEKFYWKKASTHMLWSAVLKGNNLVTVGFGVNSSDFDRTKSTSSNQIQNELINLIKRYEGDQNEHLVVNQDAYLNLIDVTITKQETLEALRQNKFVRYVEPADYRYFSFENQGNPKDNQIQSDSGCGYGTSTISSADFTTISPNAQVPWAFYKHGIPSAWGYSS
ncbi:MAG TPA: serine protease, partial [Flavobacterium sp.]|nr:serine protease [Flavobacterium sp.]